MSREGVTSGVGGVVCGGRGLGAAEPWRAWPLMTARMWLVGVALHETGSSTGMDWAWWGRDLDVVCRVPCCAGLDH